jgi:hypothetical protein
MCQEEAEELSNGSEHCQVRKVAGLLAQALRIDDALPLQDDLEYLTDDSLIFALGGYGAYLEHTSASAGFGKWVPPAMREKS